MIQFSVIIPCYNSEKTIVQCIQSVFGQTHLPFEIIVIDDGSKDSTLEILNKLKNQAPKDIDYIVVSQKNSGPSFARNKGITIAKGNWIAFLDSDDCWQKNNIEQAFSFLSNNNTFNLLGGGNVQDTFQVVSFKMLLKKNYFQTSSTIVAKNWIAKYPFNQNQKYSEDYRSWLLISSETNACMIPNYSANPVIKRNHAFMGGGLSSKLWDMEKGELSNFIYLYKLKKIGLLKLFTISFYSLIKYLRRVFIAKVK